MNLNASQRKLIGLDYVLERVNTMTPFGEQRKRSFRTWQPGQEADLRQEHEEIDKCMAYLEAGALREMMHLFCQLKDISGSVERLSRNHVLDEVEFFEIKLFAAYCQRVRRHLAKLNLAIDLKDLAPVSRLLDPEGTGLLTFHYYDAYSPLLKELRQAKRQLDRRGRQHPDYPGEAQRLSEELEEVTWQVRQKLSAGLEEWAPALLGNMQELGRLDHRIAKADYARKHACVRPAFAQTSCLCVDQMVNPMVEAILMEKGSRMEPLTLSLTPGSAILTGANMGGKSVTLKTFLLQVELFRLGYFLPCRAASLKLPDFVHYGAEDGQDVTRGLSSFGVEVLEINQILKQAEMGCGLILLDEPARGTNPLEAQAIVKALCRHFKAGDDYFFLATHLPDLPEEGMRHFQIMGLKNLLQDNIKEWSGKEPKDAIAALERNMDYRIREVSSTAEVPKEAIHVMEFLGTDPDLMREIKQILGDDYEQTELK